MPKIKRPVPWVEIKHKMPTHLKLSLDQLLTPSHCTEPPQGARQALINRLVWDWIQQHTPSQFHGDEIDDYDQIDN
jgi:hypothetical protein